MRTNYLLLLTILLGLIPVNYTHASDSIPSVFLYSPYTKISVSPGTSIDYKIDLINNSDIPVNVDLSVTGLPASWKRELKSGGWNINKLRRNIMEYSYKTKGTCSTQIDFELNGDIVSNVRFTGGCNGNLQGISSLTDGLTVEQIENKLKGIRCGFKPTSCPDQLAIAVREAYESENK